MTQLLGLPQYAGSAIRNLAVEGRLTLCNMAIEMGARMGFVAPDEKTIEYVHGREFAPTGKEWEAAVRQWRELSSDDDAAFDRDITVDASQIAPQITWGTSPQHVLNVDRPVPDPKLIADPEGRRSAERALAYMGLAPGDLLTGLPIHTVFIGSCTNSRLDDLRAAAAMIGDGHVAPGVRAMIVPGSSSVKRAAEAEGLDRVFRDAGFEWRESACSMCGAVNADKVAPGQRCVATSNRNFEGRQGPNARTHLASPAMAAAAAIAGKIVDIRTRGGDGAKI